MTDDPPELDPTELPSTEAAPSSPGDPPQIGPYRLLEKIGEGGMGEVWLAEQTEPVKRRVALKVIKAGMDTKQVVARFAAERQALAMMDHPAVAKVFDAGATPQGRPYFAMEHVKGVPITEHCDRQKSSNPERLKLFMQVCEGVQHAHQKAIIHRDLKPSNVLVSIQDGKAVPKIIDFGVAKATAQKLTERTLHTQLGVLIGTPEYMSPEQAEMTGQDVDTRTDVYSLGVMLYELLTGALPFESKDLRESGYEGIVRKIREEEPPKPSTRLSTLGDRSTTSAERRGVDLHTLRRQLRGDLDWITMRALEKDRTRRYGSPNELAADIGRHLNHEPVDAGPPGATYRVGKFVRRHKIGVAFAAAALLVLLGFAVVMSVQARRIARERDASEQVSLFLSDMLGTLDPQTLGTSLWDDIHERVAEVRRGRAEPEAEVEAMLASLGENLSGVNATDTALRLVDEQILSPAAERIERDLKEQPRIAGRLEHTLGLTYERLGLYEQGTRHFERASELREHALGAEHPDTLASNSRAGALLWYRGSHAEAERLLKETAEIQRRVLGEEHADTLRTHRELAWVYFQRGRYEESAALLVDVLEGQRRVLGEDHRDTLKSANALSAAYYGQKLYAEAEKLMREAVEIQRRARGVDHPDTAGSMLNLGVFVSTQGRYDEAEAILSEVLEIRSRVLGDEHPKTLNARNNLASVYTSLGRHSQAVEFAEETLEIADRVLSKDHRFTLAAMTTLSYAYSDAGRYAEAEALLREQLAVRTRVWGVEHPDTLGAFFSLGCVAALRGDRAAALDWLRRAVENGFQDVEEMASDADLESLHGDAEFETLVERARRNAADSQPERNGE